MAECQWDSQQDPECSPRAAALRAFELSRALGNAGLPASIDQLALVLAVHGEADTAARLAGFADGYAGQRQLSRFGIATAIRSRLVERLHSAMSPGACKAAMAAGAAWSEQEAVAAAEAAWLTLPRSAREEFELRVDSVDVAPSDWRMECPL